MAKKKTKKKPSPKSPGRDPPMSSPPISPPGSDGTVQTSDSPSAGSAPLSLDSKFAQVSVPVIDLAKDMITDPTVISVKLGQIGRYTSGFEEKSSDLGLSCENSSLNTTAKVPSESKVPLEVKIPSEAQETAKAATVANPETLRKVAQPGPKTWCDMVKGSSKKLSKQGTAFTLSSGELCTKIPNSVIEKNRKSWDCFVLGQFYSDPPSQGIIHNIANGIWSKYYRDITVTKMEGFAFLFRIPNISTRKRVLSQRLWQIEGQTMFVASWEPGITPVKPELKSAPIWLELRQVPFQFFNDDGLAHIASMVGDPKDLHPSTANKTNLEVAKVFTLIDPRKPLPEAVNVQFESGEIRRVLVSSPWMPPVCSHCKEIGHSLKRCSLAPITCIECKSTTHTSGDCPRAKLKGPKKKKRGQSISKPPPEVKACEKESLVKTSATGFTGIKSPGETSKKSVWIEAINKKAPSAQSSEVEADSSDVLSSESEGYESYDSLEDKLRGFTKVLSSRQKKGSRGKGPQLT